MRITINIERPNFGNIVEGIKGAPGAVKANVEDKIQDHKSNRIEALYAKLDTLQAQLDQADVEDEKGFAKLEDAIAKTYTKITK